MTLNKSPFDLPLTFGEFVNEEYGLHHAVEAVVANSPHDTESWQYIVELICVLPDDWRSKWNEYELPV